MSSCCGAPRLLANSERMHAFSNLEQVEEVLHLLANRKVPLLVKLPRQPGRKENRIAHLLCGAPEMEEPSLVNEPAPESARRHVEAQEMRILALEEEVANLHNEVSNLTATFAEFRRQFE